MRQVQIGPFQRQGLAQARAGAKQEQDQRRQVRRGGGGEGFGLGWGKPAGALDACRALRGFEYGHVTPMEAGGMRQHGANRCDDFPKFGGGLRAWAAPGLNYSVNRGLCDV